MKLLLIIALLSCILHAASCSLGVPVGEIKMSELNSDFCDAGPPGRYCLEDLTGWHDCHVNTKSGQMVDTIYECPANTRCACFYGPSCPGSLADPCQPFRLPPPIQQKFTAYYNSKGRQCSPMGCHDFLYSGREIQSLTEYKKRDDVYSDGVWATTFVLPGYGSGYVQSDVNWGKEVCYTQQIKTFPETSIPSYFSYNGRVMLDGRLCDQWIWRTGGHNVGQGTSLTAYYMYNQTSSGQYLPVLVEMISNTGPVGKTSLHQNISITAFLAGEVDEELLELPTFCKS